MNLEKVQNFFLNLVLICFRLKKYHISWFLQPLPQSILPSPHLIQQLNISTFINFNQFLIDVVLMEGKICQSYSFLAINVSYVLIFYIFIYIYIFKDNVFNCIYRVLTIALHGEISITCNKKKKTKKVFLSFFCLFSIYCLVILAG